MIVEIVVALALLLATAAYISLVLLSPREPVPNPSESTYRVPSSNEPLPLPSLLTTPATVELSVIVPAYNERARLGIMLRDAVRYLEELPLSERGAEEVVAGRSGAGRRELPRGVERGSYEVLVVDDGSKDGTTQVALELAAELETQWSAKGRRPRGVVKVVTLVKNRGKGGCVKHGILHASGHRILFADADGASHFPDLALLQDEMDRLESTQTLAMDAADWQGGHGVVVGSRAHLVRTEAVVKRSFLRNLLMRIFHGYLYVLGIRSIRDTQCGFKLQTRPSAAIIYSHLHSPSWIFDCELLLLATLAGIPIREVGIAWQEVQGSKIDLIRDSIGMAVDLLVIRGNYLLGRWERPAWVAVKTGEAEGLSNGVAKKKE